MGHSNIYMHLPRSLKTITIIAGSCVVLATVWALYGLMVVQTTSARTSVMSLIEQRDALVAKIAYGETLRSLLRDTAEDRAKVAEWSTLSAVDLVGKIQMIAADAAVDVMIDSIAPAALNPTVAKDSPALTVSVSANGTFAHLYHFIQLLETSPLPLGIEQLSLEHQGSSNAPWTLRARVLVYTENAK
jgi:hypothetical protein